MLNQINKPTFEEFKNVIQQSASQLNSIFHAVADNVEFLNQITTVPELESIGITEAEAQVALADYRTALNELNAFFNGTGTAQTIVPADIVDKIRRMK